MQTVTLYTDAACNPNPGHGGYAAMLKAVNGKTKSIAGAIRLTSAPRAKMMAILSGLRSLKEPCIVNVHTNLEYLAGVYDKIKQHGNTENSSNSDLWESIITLGHKIKFCIFNKRDTITQEQEDLRYIANTYANKEIAKTDVIDTVYEESNKEKV